MNTALVVPTIRVKHLHEFLNAWFLAKEEWDYTIIVEDGPEKSYLPVNVTKHVSWKEIDEDLKDMSWIISRRDSAIRSYGFLLADRMGADYIFTLDDDCLPSCNKFIDKHIQNLCLVPRWCGSIPRCRTRGMPYRNHGICKNINLSVGLWRGVPDFDSIQSLSGEDDQLELPFARVMPPNQYFPMCGMNLAFRRDLTPAMFFPMMGQGYPFGRFDDIWCGIICKKICDHLHWPIVCGEPYVHHNKASNPFDNLVKEAQGIKYNEIFWEIIDSLALTSYTAKSCMMELGSQLEDTQNVYSQRFKVDEFFSDYLRKLGRAMHIWASLFSSP